MFMRIALVFALVFTASGALAQSVQQSGSVTPNTAAIWNSTGVIKGGVTATDSPLTTFGVTRDAVDGFCVSSARQSAVGRNQLCFQAATNGPGKISLQNYGTATPQDLQFVINGTPVTIPTGGGAFLLKTGGQTTGHMPCFTATTNILQDCGVGARAGTQWGVPYYSDAGTLSSSGAAGAGQFFLGQGPSAPLWTTLSGDVQTVSAGGALTLNKVNGIPFSTSYTAHGVLLAQGSSAFTSLTTSSVGQCLLSQGTSSDPIWSSCAAGTGSAGGSNTQVQFNNSTSLGGSANLTWVSPALTIGVAGTTTGQLALASSTATGTVTLQAPGVSGTYNFNYPTGAGTTGQPLISGGGGSSPNTFGTLGIFGGGTNCSIASGTCLDNITGFSSTGFVFRSGAGTYTFTNPIPAGNGGTGLASGTSGGILGFTGASTIASSGLLTQYSVMVGGGAGATPSVITKGTAGQILIDQTSANPSWNSMSGDATINSSGAVTIANSAVTVAKMANAAAYSLMGNFTGSSAAPQLSTIGALTQKASPAASDLVLIQDQAASGQLKYAQVSAIASAGSVSSIAGNTGAFTLTQPITNATNAIVLNAAINPGGRLTLTSSAPVMTSTVSAATTVYYTPYIGNLVPIYDGTNFIPTSFGELSITLGSNWTTNSNWDVFIASDSGTLRACTGPAWTSDTARGTGAGTTELQRIGGMLLNKVALTCRYNNTTTFAVAANRGTYVGTFRTGSAGQTNYIFGTLASGGTAALLGVWNMYNRVDVTTAVQDNAPTWSYTSATVRPSDNSTNNRISFVTGAAEDGFSIHFAQRLATAGSGVAQVGVGLDSTTVMTIAAFCQFNVASGSPCAVNYAPAPQLGFHFFQALEAGDGSNATTYVGGGSQYNFVGRLRM